ncbi:MAG: Abi family protein [Methylococcaceae bacterium]
MSSAKPWKSFPEQLELLKARGLQCDDEGAALDYLERIGYYRLSGYWYPFRRLEILAGAGGSLGGYIRHDNFVKGSHFKDAAELYVFDKRLRLLALDALERIELAVRVDIAHFLGEKDIHAHENPALFNGHFSNKKNKEGETQHTIWLKKYNQCVHRARREPFVSHYQEKYGKLPIWVAIEIWDFGLMSKLFSGMKPQDQLIIAKKYGAATAKDFSGWLRSLNFIRNVSAHHSRLWNINILERSRLVNDDDFWKSLNNARPFFYFCVIQKIMQVICPNSTWSIRFADLLNQFPEVDSGAVSLKDFGLLEDWNSWSLWKQT